MRERPITVFLSGTRRDLEDFYPAAKTAIETLPGYVVAMMDDAEAEDIHPAHWSRRAAAVPDVLIGLIGRYYGKVVKLTGKSLTEEEYLAAKQIGIDRLMFISEGGDVGVATSQTPEAKALIADFRAIIDDEVVRKDVDTPEDFARETVAALRAWEEQTFRGALVKAEVFFPGLLGERGLFGHAHSLVGHDNILSSLKEFAESDRRVYVLEGPWGRGKSRIGLELYRWKPDLFRFLRPEVEPARHVLGLSPRDPRIIIVDDAHNRTPEALRALVDIVRRCDKQIKIIFLTRPDQRSRIDAALLDNGIPAADIKSAVLPALSYEQQTALVEGIAGGPSPTTAWVVARTMGTTLPAVIAAKLLHASVPIHDLERSDDFNYEVLRRFRQEQIRVAGVTTADQAFMERVLEAVAVAGPIRPGDESQMTALALFLGVQKEELHRVIARLEETVLLVRRGGLVRVVLDAVAEALVFGACVTKHGERTGFADRAFAELSGRFRRNLLRNLALAEHEWARRERRGSVLERLWPVLIRIYESLGRDERLGFLKDIAQIGPLQPREALNFVRAARRLGLGKAGSFSSLMSQTLLDQGFVDVLQGVLLHPQELGAALDILWELAKADPLTPGVGLSAAERALREVGAYRQNRSIHYYQALADWAERRAFGAESIPGDRLARYIAPLLEKEVEYGWSSGSTIRIGSLPLDRQRSAPIRRQMMVVLRLICEQQAGPSRAEALRALVVMLRGPDGRVRPVSEEEVAGWESDILEATDLLEEVHRSCDDRVATIVLRNEIWQFADHACSDVIRKRAAAFLRHIEEGLKGSVESAMSGPARPREVGQDVHLEAISNAAEMIFRGQDEPAKALRLIRKTDDRLRGSGVVCPGTGELLGEIVRRKPSWGRAFLEEIANEAEHPLSSASPRIIEQLLTSDPGARDYVQGFLDRGPVTALRSIAWQLRFPQLAEVLSHHGVIEQLGKYLAHLDSGVRRGALVALGIGRHLESRARASLLMSYDIETWPGESEEIAIALGDPALYGILRFDQKKQLAGWLALPERLGAHSSMLVEQLIADCPEEVIDTFVSRIRAAEDRESGYEPLLMDGGHRPFAALGLDGRERAIRRLGPLVGHPSWYVHSPARMLFREIAGGSDDLIRQVVDEWIGAGSKEDLEMAAGAIGSQGQPALHLYEGSLVNLMRKAEALSDTFVKDVIVVILAGSGVDGGMRARGEADPEEASIRDWARQARNTHAAGSAARELFDAIAQHAQGTLEFFGRLDDESEFVQ